MVGKGGEMGLHQYPALPLKRRCKMPEETQKELESEVKKEQESEDTTDLEDNEE